MKYADGVSRGGGDGAMNYDATQRKTAQRGKAKGNQRERDRVRKK